MHILLVVIHVSMMIASMALMASAVGIGLFGKSFAAKLATGGFVTTIVGTVSGIILLLDSPLSIQCAILTTYLVAATILYRYGFALGDANAARLVRTP